MLATIMSANVLMVIIPGQRKVMAQMKAGEPVDPVHGQRAKQRSVHNTYFTLPVLIAMLSNHYGMLYQAKHNWLVLVLLMLAGVLIRQFFLLRHKGVINWGWWAGGIAVIVGLVVWLAPQPPPRRRHASSGPADRRPAGAGAAAAAQRLPPRPISRRSRRSSTSAACSATTPASRRRTCASTRRRRSPGRRSRSTSRSC